MPEQRYWDGTAFAAWLQQDPERADGCREVLARAEAGDCVIWTSPLAMVACVDEAGWHDIEPADRLTVYDFFRRRYVKLVQLDRAVAEFAWDIMADHQLSHRQAVHVAGALKARAELLETFDVDLLKLSEQIAGHQHLRIQRPRVDKGPLFDQLEASLPLEDLDQTPLPTGIERAANDTPQSAGLGTAESNDLPGDAVNRRPASAEDAEPEEAARNASHTAGPTPSAAQEEPSPNSSEEAQTPS